MKHFSKTLVAALGLLTVVAMAPTTASASGNLHLNLPGLSIGLHDNDHGHKKHRKRYRNKHYRDNHYSHDDRRHDRYYNQRRNHRHYYNDRRDRRYYNNHRSYNDYYYSSRRNNDRRYSNRSYSNNSRRGDVCPMEGYSRNYNRNLNCYKHKGHFHCS